eukprot:jgi/Psemu1/53425/gm1.53425_g
MRYPISTWLPYRFIVYFQLALQRDHLSSPVVSYASTPPLSMQLALPKALREGTILPNGILTFAEHSTYSSHLRYEIYLISNQTVFCIPKRRHRDALKIKMRHLYAHLLPLNWFDDTFD